MPTTAKILSACVMLAFAFMHAGCNAPKPAKCVVTVRDYTGNKLMAGVAVQLYANVNNQQADLVANAVTDKDGRAVFTFKNACVMDVKATVSNCTTNAGNNNYCTGAGIVKCEEGKTAEKTIKISQ